MIKVEHTTLACADPGTGRRRTGVAVVLLYVMIAGSNLSRGGSSGHAPRCFKMLHTCTALRVGRRVLLLG
jgi:hypothetical protein